MNDEEIRELVRSAIVRRLLPNVDRSSDENRFDRRDASQRLLQVPPGSAGDGACLIEPAVHCNHCGYCMSFGH
jgi:hypothetical protein